MIVSLARLCTVICWYGVTGSRSFQSRFAGGVEGEGVPPLPNDSRGDENFRANRTSLRLGRFSASEFSSSPQGGVRGEGCPLPLAFTNF